MKKIQYFVFLFAFIIRLTGISDFNLSWDEISGMDWNIGNSIFKSIHLILQYDVHPPTYYLLLRPFLYLPFSVELRLRLLSAILGVIGIYIIYRITVLIFDEKTALIVSFIMTLLPMHFYHSQEARMYTLLFLVSGLFLGVWYKYRKERNKKWLKYLIASSIIGFYSHYYFVFPFFYALIVTTVECIFRRERLINLSRIIVVTGIFISPLLIFAKASPLNSSFKAQLTEHAGWLIHSNISKIIENFKVLFVGYFYSFDSTSIVSLLLLSIILGGVFAIREKKKGDFLFLLGYATVPLILLFMASIISEHILGSAFYEHRHSMFSLPAFAILLAYPISRMNRYLSIISIVSLLFIFLQLDISYVAYKDRSFFEMRKYYNKHNGNKNDIWLAPYALYTVGKEYFDKDKTDPLTTPDYSKLSTEEIHLKIDKRMEDKHISLMVWRDIGQLIGEGERQDIIARDYLIHDYDFATEEVYFCPYSESKDITLFKEHAKRPVPGFAVMDFSFNRKCSLAYKKRGDNKYRTFLGVSYNQKVMLKTGNIYLFKSDIYHGLNEFFIPYFLFPPMYLRYPGDFRINIKLPFWFSSWWSYVINISWISLFLSLFVCLIISIKDYILKKQG